MSRHKPIFIIIIWKENNQAFKEAENSIWRPLLSTLYHCRPYIYMNIYGCLKYNTNLSNVFVANPYKKQIFSSDGKVRKLYYRSLHYLYIQKIQTFVLKSRECSSGQPSNGGPNEKLKARYNNSNKYSMMKHGRRKFTPPHMNAILLKAWDAFNLSSVNLVRDIFKIKKTTSPHYPQNFYPHQFMCCLHPSLLCI